jgi:hypothetical protein
MTAPQSGEQVRFGGAPSDTEIAVVIERNTAAPVRLGVEDSSGQVLFESGDELTGSFNSGWRT